MIVQRVEQHKIKSSNPYFVLLKEYCRKSKDLYNHGNFLIRQSFLSDNSKYLSYYDEEFGVAVITTEESYTSGTSFLDNELPTKENYNKSRRIQRGLFRSNDGTLINADQNGAYQILRKVVPITWDRGEVLSPVLVDLD